MDLPGLRLGPRGLTSHPKWHLNSALLPKGPQSHLAGLPVPGAALQAWSPSGSWAESPVPGVTEKAQLGSAASCTPALQWWGEEEGFANEPS